jgi:hypothetical protein
MLQFRQNNCIVYLTLTQVEGTDEEISSLYCKSINSPFWYIMIFVNEMAVVGTHAVHHFASSAPHLSLWKVFLK